MRRLRLRLRLVVVRLRSRIAPRAAAVRLALALALAFVFAGKAGAQHLVIVTGISGEPQYAQRFTEWSSQLARAAEEKYGLARENVIVLSEGGTGAAKATKANLATALQRVGARARADEDVAIVLFGHGAASGGEARFNLSGPDLTPAELDAMLDALRVRRITVVNTASASGAFLEPLAGAGRVIITATKSGMEQNETMFPRFFVAALTGADADTDRDGRVSLLEAFTYAQREVERAYESDRRLRTEHAVLAPSEDVARDVFLGAPRAAAAAAPANASAELRALYDEKQRLENELAQLRARQSSLPAADYQAALEKLLLDVARNGQAIRRAEGGT